MVRVLFTVHVHWGQVATRTVWPHFAWTAGGAAVMVAVFGTTISPYLFFWQASEQVEEMQEKGNFPLTCVPAHARPTCRPTMDQNCSNGGD